VSHSLLGLHAFLSLLSSVTRVFLSCVSRAHPLLGCVSMERERDTHTHTHAHTQPLSQHVAVLFKVSVLPQFVQFSIVCSLD